MCRLVGRRCDDVDDHHHGGLHHGSHLNEANEVEPTSVMRQVVEVLVVVSVVVI